MACVAVNCKNYSNNKILRQTTNISFHRFPKSIEIQKKWMKAVRRANWLPTKHSRICSEHFEPSCFIEGVKYRVLRTDAVPTIFQGYPIGRVPKKRKYTIAGKSLKFKQLQPSTIEDFPESSKKKRVFRKNLKSMADIDLSVTKVCCTCLSFDIAMFSLTHIEIRESFEKVITNIKIEQDELLQNVCAECVLMIRKIVTFKENCLESNQRLRQMLTQSTYTQNLLNKESQKRNDYDDEQIIPDTNIVKQETFTNESELNTDLENITDNLDSHTDINNDSFEEEVKLEHSPLIIIVEENKYDLDIQYDESCVNSKLMEAYKVEDKTLETTEDEDDLKSVKKSSQINKFRGLKGETAYAVQVTLTKEEQMEEFLERQNTESYLNAHFKCTHCLTGFISNEKLEQHMELHDESRGALQCDVCKLRYCNVHRLRQHQTTHKLRYKCLTCGEISVTQLLAMRHHNRHVDSLPYSTCKICKETFQYNELYKRHIRTAHPTDYVCDLCGDYFTSQFHLENHQKQATDCRKPPINIIECKRCDAYFLSVNTWYSHMLAHSDESDQIPPTECQICGHETTTWMDWRWHVGSEHRNKNIDEKKNKQRKAEKVQCNQCGKMLKNKTSLVQHIQRNHADTAIGASSDNKHYIQQCEVCNKTLLKQNMRRHMIIHTGEKPYKCDVCGKCYNQAVTRDEHIKIVHEKSKLRRYMTHKSLKKKPSIFECETCQKQFASKMYLTIHIRRHTGERPFSCDVCHERFITRVRLQLHQSVHTGEVYSCDVCDQKYANKQNLRTHKRKHTGEKPFACDICDMRFLYNSNMKRHKLVHTGAKDFACELCGKTFAQKSSMTGHINTVHFNLPPRPRRPRERKLKE